MALFNCDWCAAALVLFVRVAAVAQAALRVAAALATWRLAGVLVVLDTATCVLDVVPLALESCRGGTRHGRIIRQRGTAEGTPRWFTEMDAVVLLLYLCFF